MNVTAGKAMDMPKGTATTGLLDAWKEAGSPELDDSGETPPEDNEESEDIPLEADDEDDSLPVEEDDDSEDDAATGSEGGTAETPPAGEDDEWPDDLPESYFGRDLKEYAATHGLEATKAYHTALQDATKDYNRRLEKLAEERKNATSDERTQQPPADEEVDVDEILREMGVNVNNPYAEEIRDDVLAPMAQMIAELRNQQETSSSSVEAEKFERDFFTGLDAAEQEFNDKLPDNLERQDILDLAIQSDIYSPRALYLSIMAPVWKADSLRQSTEADEAKKTAKEATKRAKKAASSAKGRRSSAPSSTSKPVKKGSIEDAAKAAARALGRSTVRLEK